MKRTIGTIVLFVLLVLTVVALNQLGNTQTTSALKSNASATANRGTR